MKTLATTILLGLGMVTSNYASAGHDTCSLKSLVGKWVFATDVGHQMLGGPFPPDKDITAIGTIVIDRFGGLTSNFDVTIQDFMFFPGNTSAGSIAVNRDCTGTLTFISSAGTARTDSIVILGPREFLGMSQDPLNLWTYQARKVSRRNN